MRSQFQRLIYLISGVLLISSCTLDTKTRSLENDDNAEQHLAKIKPVLYSLPSPLESSLLIERSGIAYNQDYLNPTKNVSGYVTQNEIAVNIGVYAADLSYAAIYNNPQTVIKYLSVIKKMASELGIKDELSKGAMLEIRDNMNNKNTMLRILSETFLNNESYLQKQYRPDLAALTIFGGWLETTWLVCNLVKDNPENQAEIISLLISQKMSIDDLVNLLKDNNKNGVLDVIIKDMESLERIFTKVNYQSTGIVAGTSVHNVQVKSVTLDAVPDRMLRKLIGEVEKIRNSHTFNH